MWQDSEGKLTRTFEFSNFVEALTFVNKVGEIAERLGHHPDITIRDYRYVAIATTTHDAGFVVTEKDRELAEAVDRLL